MNDRTRRALRLAIGVIYDDLTTCVECGMNFSGEIGCHGTPISGTLSRDSRARFRQVIEAAHAVEAEIGRHLAPDAPDWLPDIIDGRIAP